MVKSPSTILRVYFIKKISGFAVPPKKLSDFFKVPKSFFLKQPTLIHHGKDNSFGPIYHNSNFYFAKPETEEDIKRLLNK